MISFLMSELRFTFCAELGLCPNSTEQIEGRFFSESVSVCVFSEGEKFAVMFSFSTSLWPSPDHSSSPLDDTETSSPRKETPCSPVGRQYKVHCNSCVFVCMSVFKRNGGKRRTVSIHTLADSLK